MILWRAEGKSGLSGDKVFVMVIFFLSTKALPTPSMLETMHLMHFSWQFQIQSCDSLGLHSYRHDLGNLHRKDCGKLLDLRKLPPSQPYAPTSHPSFLPSLCFSTFAILLPSNICSRDRNRYPLCFAVEETEALRSEIILATLSGAEKWQRWAVIEDSGRQPRALSLRYVAFGKEAKAHSFVLGFLPDVHYFHHLPSLLLVPCFLPGARLCAGCWDSQRWKKLDLFTPLRTLLS